MKSKVDKSARKERCRSVSYTGSPLISGSLNKVTKHHRTLEADTSAITMDAASESEMRECFHKLMDLVPTIPQRKKVTKVELLQHVIDYILDLESTLDISAPELFLEATSQTTIMHDSLATSSVQVAFHHQQHQSQQQLHHQSPQQQTCERKPLLESCQLMAGTFCVPLASTPSITTQRLLTIEGANQTSQQKRDCQDLQLDMSPSCCQNENPDSLFL